MVGELKLYCIYLIRRYEVNDLAPIHLLKTLNRGLQHHVANLSSAYGRPKRRPISRIHKRSDLRLVWYFSCKRGYVKKVYITSSLEFRKKTLDGKVKVKALFKKSRREAFLDVMGLYETKQQALAAREHYDKTGMLRNAPIINLAPHDLDEFQTTNTSLLAERGENGARLIDLIPGDEEKGRSKDFLNALSKSATPELEEFAELVVCEDSDGLFARHCGSKNRNVAILTQEQLGKLAARYIGISLGQLKIDILRTHAHLWTQEQQQLMLHSSSPSFGPIPLDLVQV